MQQKWHLIQIDTMLQIISRNIEKTEGIHTKFASKKLEIINPHHV